MAATRRGTGGFRLYTEQVVHSRAPVRGMRLLGSVLKDIRELLAVPEWLPAAGGPASQDDEEAHEELVAMLKTYWQEADARCADLLRELTVAEDLTRSPRRQPARPIDAAGGSGAAGSAHPEVAR